MIIEVPDDYMPTKTTIVLTHEDAATAPNTDLNTSKVNLVQASGYYVASRIYANIRIQQEKRVLSSEDCLAT